MWYRNLSCHCVKCSEGSHNDCENKYSCGNYKKHIFKKPHVLDATEYKYRCSHCDKKYKNSEKLFIKHLQKAHGINNDNISVNHNNNTSIDMPPPLEPNNYVLYHDNGYIYGNNAWNPY